MPIYGIEKYQICKWAIFSLSYLYTKFKCYLSYSQMIWGKNSPSYHLVLLGWCSTPEAKIWGYSPKIFLHCTIKCHSPSTITQLSETCTQSSGFDTWNYYRLSNDVSFDTCFIRTRWKPKLIFRRDRRSSLNINLGFHRVLIKQVSTWQRVW